MCVRDSDRLNERRFGHRYSHGCGAQNTMSASNYTKHESHRFKNTGTKGCAAAMAAMAQEPSVQPSHTLSSILRRLAGGPVFFFVYALMALIFLRLSVCDLEVFW